MRVCCAVLALSIFALFASDVLADEPKLERYYIGVGLEFIRIDSKTVAWGDYKNQPTTKYPQGPLTGLTVVYEVMKRSLAESSGIKWMDVLVSVDGTDIANLSIERIENLINDGLEGSIVILKIRKVYFNGGPIADSEKEFFLKREKLDRVAWLNLSFEIGCTTSTSNSKTGVIETGLKFRSSVSEDRDRKVFKYVYKLENIGEETIQVNCEAVNLALFGMVKAKNLFCIQPGETREVVVETSDFPVLLHGSLVEIFTDLTNDKNADDCIEMHSKYFNQKVHFDKKNVWGGGMSTSTSFYIPAQRSVNKK